MENVPLPKNDVFSEIFLVDEESQITIPAQVEFVYQDEELNPALLGTSTVVVDVDENHQLKDLQPLGTDSEITSYEIITENPEGGNSMLRIHGKFPKA